MLQNNFFVVDSLNSENNLIGAVVSIQTNHPIFDGHFPGQPVVPGVCMLQIVKELTEIAQQQKYRVQSAVNMKFLTVIDPRIHATIHAAITVEPDEDNVKISASLFAGDITFFKLKAAFKPL
jgi:3-hydroxyacyl-[acyl-carrier-protein] dehydratase